VVWDHPTNADRGVDSKRNASINHAAREMLLHGLTYSFLCAFTSGVKYSLVLLRSCRHVYFLPYTASTTRATPHMAYIYRTFVRWFQNYLQ